MTTKRSAARPRFPVPEIAAGPGGSPAAEPPPAATPGAATPQDAGTSITAPGSPDDPQEIERTREQLGETVEALAAKSDVKARAKASVREVENWSFLTNHARVLLCIAHDPGPGLCDIAASVGRRTAAVTATRSRHTCRCPNPPAPDSPSAKSSLSSWAPMRRNT
jgi:Protein of unknown function (DUF3618)